MLLGFKFKKKSCWSLCHIFPIQNPSEVRERGKKKHRQSNCLSNTLNKIWKIELFIFYAVLHLIVIYGIVDFVLVIFYHYHVF